jgi:hypothetical protein
MKRRIQKIMAALRDTNPVLDDDILMNGRMTINDDL